MNKYVCSPSPSSIKRNVYSCATRSGRINSQRVRCLGLAVAQDLMVGVHNNTFSAIEIFILEKLQRLITVDLDHFGQLKAGGSLFAMIDASYCSFLPTYIQSKFEQNQFCNT